MKDRKQDTQTVRRKKREVKEKFCATKVSSIVYCYLVSTKNKKRVLCGESQLLIVICDPQIFKLIFLLSVAMENK